LSGDEHERAGGQGLGIGADWDRGLIGFNNDFFHGLFSSQPDFIGAVISEAAGQTQKS
jgi:hypothetical protein